MELLIKLFKQMLINALDNPKIPKVIRLIIITLTLLMIITTSILAGYSVIVSTDISEAIIYWMVATGCMLILAFGDYKIYQTRKANNDYYRVLLFIHLKDSKYSVFYWRFSLSSRTKSISTILGTKPNKRSAMYDIPTRRAIGQPFLVIIISWS